MAPVHQDLKPRLCIAIAALRKCKDRIGSLEQARSLNGVGEKTAQKVMTAALSPHRFCAQLRVNSDHGDRRDWCFAAR